MRIVKLTKETTENILENMLKRSPTQYGTYEASVQEIIENVKTKKDAAVFEYTEKFDHAVLDASTVEVTQEEIDEVHISCWVLRSPDAPAVSIRRPPIPSGNASRSWCCGQVPPPVPRWGNG